MTDGAEAIGILEASFPDAILGKGSFRDQHWVVVGPERLVEVARFLRDDPRTAFDVCLDVTAAHWPERAETPMEIVVHLHSRGRNDRLRIKVPTGDRGPVPTISSIWSSANWNEREAYDMFGIVFDGHPDLRRILMPDEYTDHPLRKEFPLFRG